MFEEIKGRLSSRNNRDLLSSCLQSRNINTVIYRNWILPVLYGCETWFFIFREIIGWGCYRIRCWGRYSGLRGVSKQGTGANYTVRRSVICACWGVHLAEWSGRGIWHYGREERCYGFLWGNAKEGDHLEDLCIGLSVILKWIENRMGKRGRD
jgi:hypothetical protein